MHGHRGPRQSGAGDDGREPRLGAHGREERVIADRHHVAKPQVRGLLEQRKRAVAIAEREVHVRQHHDVELLGVGASLDLREQRMGGLSYMLIRRVRALGGENATLPAIALTAYAHGEDKARALQEGFQQHLPKPVEPKELFAAVETAALLSRRR